MSDLYSRAIDAMNARIEATEAAHAAKRVENIRRRIAIFEQLERPIFRALTEKFLGEPLEITMNLGTGEPVPVPVSDLVSLTIDCRYSISGSWDGDLHLFREVDRVDSNLESWSLKVVSDYLSSKDRAEVVSLEELGTYLVSAQDYKDWQDKREKREEIEAAEQTPPRRYEFLNEYRLNHSERPFEVIGSGFYDSDENAFFVLVRYTDLDCGEKES